MYITLLLYDISTYIILLTGIHPFLYILVTFFPCLYYLNIRIEYCGALGAVFFAAIMRKRYNFTVKYSYQSFYILGTLWVMASVNFFVGFCAQLFLDYYVFAKQSQNIYQQKTYNRFAALLLVLYFSTDMRMQVALLLGMGVGHGVLLSWIL